MADAKKPKKVKISRETGKKIRKATEVQAGADKAGLLKAIADALRKKNQGGGS